MPSSFYKQLFCTKVFFAAFSYLLFVFVIFLKKKIMSAKCARKMLVKLTLSVLPVFLQLLCIWISVLLLKPKKRILVFKVF